MATSKAQRAGIWVIAVALTVGTIAGFIAMIIAPQNEAIDQANAQEEYQKMIEEMQKQQSEQRQAASKPLDGYKASSFNATSIKDLKVTYLKKGNGDKVKTADKISANYFGWTSDGKIFDSTNQDGTVTPAEFTVIEPEDSPDGSGVIKGWVDGLTGVPVGSTVELTIPGDMAYGNKDNGDGRPVGPLKFIVIIEKIVKE